MFRERELPRLPIMTVSRLFLSPSLSSSVASLFSSVGEFFDFDRTTISQQSGFTRFCNQGLMCEGGDKCLVNVIRPTCYNFLGKFRRRYLFLVALPEPSLLLKWYCSILYKFHHLIPPIRFLQLHPCQIPNIFFYTAFPHHCP
ncbi:hypothetical protein RND81_07G109000 [Saponaria officinalis]|uniref:Uncharacterized protein n=1 Tax=Saponaria officinalis TaxID=3572 RepID=A0AAW1JQI7_SAPOF